MAKKNVVRQDVVQISFDVEQSPIDRIDRALDDVRSNAADMAQTAERAANEVSQIGTEAVEAARSSERLRNSGFQDAEIDAESAANAARRFTRETEEAGRSSQQLGEQTREGSEESGDAIESLTGSVGELTGAFAGVAAAFAVGQIIQGVNEVEQAMNRLQGQVGATSAEMTVYRDVVQDLYTDGKGQTIGDVADAMALVNQQFKDLDNDTMRNITNDAMVLVETFDMDLNETLRGVNALMMNMELTAGEAFNYIAKGAQNGLDKSHELSDNIAEYSQLWAQAGFSAEEMFTILQNGLDSGAYNLDKVNDFVKEFTISLSDGRIEKNIESFSEGTQTLFAEWQKGGASQKDVFNAIINDLSNMTSEQEALSVASTVWSALGEDNAMKVITSLTKVNSTYAEVGDTMESINNVRYDDLGSSLERLKRTGGEMLNQTFAPALSKVNNALADGLEWVNKFSAEHEALAAGISTAVIAATALTVAIGGGLVIAKLVPPVIAKISASMATLNVSLGAVGIAIGAVSVGLGLIAGVAKSAKQEVEDYDGSLYECRQELERTRDAHKKAAERYGENSDAAKGLEKNLKKLNAQYEKGGGYLGELQQSIEETTAAFEEMSSAQDSAMDSIAKSEIQGLQAVSMLEAISSKANITSTDLNTMSKYADYLNDTFNCNIVVNYDTGELTGFDPEAITKQIIALANDKKVQAAMDYITNPDFTSGYLDAVENLQKAKANKRLIEKGLVEGSKDFDNTLMNEFSTDMSEVNQALEDAQSAMDVYNAELEEYGYIVDKSGETTKLFKDALYDTASHGGEFLQFYEKSKEVIDGATESTYAINDAVATYNDELYNLAAAYDEALVAAQESVAGQYAVWEEVGELAKTSVNDIKTALDSQSQYWSDYSSNLEILQEKAQSIEGLSDMLATMADGSEDSASAIAALAGASDEDLSAVVANWQSVKENQDIASQSIADTASQFTIKLGEIGTEMGTLVDDMDMSEEATLMATTTINAYIDSILFKISSRKGEVTSALNSLMITSNQYGVSVSEPVVPGHAGGTTYGESAYIAGERGAELILDKQGSTVFPASETNKIIDAVADYTGGYSPKSSGRVVQNNTTYAPQFTLNLNGASATDSNKRTVKRWIKESFKEMLDNMANDNAPLLEI